MLLMEESGYDLKKLKSSVDGKWFKRIKFMGDEKFLEYVSKTIFGFTSKEYYVSKVSDEINF